MSPSDFESKHPRKTDGKWKQADHPETAIELTYNDVLATRQEQIESGQAVPAMVLMRGRFKNSRDWWDVHAVTAEFDEASNIPKMGEYLPGATRRTPRRTYSSDTSSVQMPSAATIKKFAATMDGGSFDIPVSGEVNGDRFTGWVRCRQVEPGVWYTHTLGEQNFGMSEAVAAVLEARRPTTALNEAGNLLDRRIGRIGMEPKGLSSGWLSGVAFDPASKTLFTKTKAGKLYGHLSTRDTFETIVSDPEPGVVWNQRVKGSPQVSVSSCPVCLRIYAERSKHLCEGAISRPEPQRADVSSGRARAGMLLRQAFRRRKRS